MSQFNQNIYIVSGGAQTAVGQNLRISAANTRANIFRISEHSEFEDAKWNPIKTGLAGYLIEYMGNSERMLSLGKNAFKESLSPLTDCALDQAELPVYIGLPQDRPGLDQSLTSQIENTLNKEFKLSLPYRFNFIQQGHAGAITGLESSLKAFEENKTSLALVGGIDSYIDTDTVTWLEKQKLLKCCGRKGLIPGEAAGFCLLATEEAAQKYNLTKLARLVSVGTAEEQNDFFSGHISYGEALSSSIFECLEALGEGQKVNQIYSTLNGVPFDSNEYGYTLLKLGEQLEDPGHTKFLSQHWGDIGAASIPVFMGVATTLKSQRRAKGPLTLFFTSSLGSNRGAVLIELLKI